MATALALALGWLVTRAWLPERLRIWGHGHRYSHQFERLARLLDSAAAWRARSQASAAPGKSFFRASDPALASSLAASP